MLAFLLIAPLAAAADLATRLDHIIDSAPALSDHWFAALVERALHGQRVHLHPIVGAQVLRLSDGRVLYARNSERLLVPASNMKLFTTALALSKLGADYRLTTRIAANSGMKRSGKLAGDLELIGGGDLSLSGREYPYDSHAAPDAIYSFSAIEELADRLIARGLKRVDGNVIGDDSRYVWEPQPDGWPSPSARREYAATVSALVLHDNIFALTLWPGERAGDLARIAPAPAFENFAIDNRVVTIEAGERKIEFSRGASGRELHAWGVIPRGDAGFREELAIGDPALYAAEALRDALLRRRVAVRGEAVARHRFPDQSTVTAPNPDVVLAEHRSPPMLDLLQVMVKVSQALHAEIVLREVAVASGHLGSRQAGLDAMNDFLAGIGIPMADHEFADGSGLSRATQVTPAAIIKLLAHMNTSRYREQWLDLLPIGGVDGTLGARFAGHPEARSIHAKTGTLSHVRALSGYADTPGQGRLAFSFLVNDFDGPDAEVTAVLDQLALALLQ
ncbi:MAG: D-alanyl-D-alanine carboxypeptidase/D-alanyl-D-alanine-endopeptidase [Bryobacteraceae bacterium]